MSINKTRRGLFLAQRTLGDVNAVAKGRTLARVFNRIIGRLSNRALRRVWK